MSTFEFVSVLMSIVVGLGITRLLGSIAGLIEHRETIRLDSRTKLLNPKWYEGMLDSGYEGVREVAKRLNFTLGWSATSGAVDNFVYEEANETFINDPEMRKRLLELNPHSFRRIVGTLLEVNGRGYWETSDENIQQLQELYQEVEDRIEGVA